MTPESRPPLEASAGDIAQLAGALAAAFDDDPVFGWLLPDTASRPRRLTSVFALELQHVVLPAGTIWTADPLTGACLELPPDRWRLPLTAQLAHARAFARIFGRRLPVALALITLMEHKHLRERHFYIPYVGVSPQAQGSGLGTRLMSSTLARCDRDGLPAYLEATSERNAALYQRLGFEHLGAYHLGNSPPLWPMRRPAR